MWAGGNAEEVEESAWDILLSGCSVACANTAALEGGSGREMVHLYRVEADFLSKPAVFHLPMRKWDRVVCYSSLAVFTVSVAEIHAYFVKTICYPVWETP